MLPKKAATLFGVVDICGCCWALGARDVCGVLGGERRIRVELKGKI